MLPAICSTAGTSPPGSVTAPGAPSTNYSPKSAAQTHLSLISILPATNRAPTGSTRSSSAASNTANTPDGYATPRGKASRPRTPRPRNYPLADDNPRPGKHDHRYGQGRRAPRDCSRSSASRRSSTIVTVSGEGAHACTRPPPPLSLDPRCVTNAERKPMGADYEGARRSRA